MNFDMSRLRRSDQIIGVSAIAFFIFLFFFKWYGVSSNVGSLGNVSFSKSGWDVFTNSRWIWLITIIVAIGAVVAVGASMKLELPVKPSVIVAGLGALSTLLILYRILHHPTASASYGSFHASVGIKIGIWLGLIAAAGITYGGYLAMGDEGTTLADVRAQASDAIGGLGGSAGDGGATSSGGATNYPTPPASSDAGGAAPPAPPAGAAPPIPLPPAAPSPPESAGETPPAS
jgi:hypothetical protein